MYSTSNRIQLFQVIFTAGATAGLKLVAECFAFQGEAIKKLSVNSPTSNSELKTAAPESLDAHRLHTSPDAASFAYLDECHTSAIGMREIAFARNVDTVCLSQDDIKVTDGDELEFAQPVKSNSLVVFPGQSNFCGRKYPLEWVQAFRSGSANIPKCSRRQWKVYVEQSAVA